MRSLIRDFTLVALASSTYTTAAHLNQPPQRPITAQLPAEAPDGGFGKDAGGLPFSTAKLEAYIEDVMERWHAAGLAISVINGNETWAKVG